MYRRIIHIATEESAKEHKKRLEADNYLATQAQFSRVNVRGHSVCGCMSRMFGTVTIHTAEQLRERPLRKHERLCKRCEKTYEGNRLILASI